MTDLTADIPGIGNLRTLSVDDLTRALVKGRGGARNWADRYAHVEPVVRWFLAALARQDATATLGPPPSPQQGA